MRKTPKSIWYHHESHMVLVGKPIPEGNQVFKEYVLKGSELKELKSAIVRYMKKYCWSYSPLASWIIDAINRRIKRSNK